MSIQWYVGRILLGVSLIAAVGCDNAKPLIDAADVKVDKLTQSGTFLRVDGANLSWFQSAKLEDSSGVQVSAGIALKMDDYLMLDLTTGLASGGSSALTIGQTYILVLDAGLKEPFRSEPVVLQAGAAPTVSLSSSQYFINQSGLLNLSGNCSINGLPIEIILSQASKADQNYTSVCSMGTWSHTSSIFGFDDGVFAIAVSFSDGSTVAQASAAGLRDTVLPVLSGVSGFMSGSSNQILLPIQFSISDANFTDVFYEVVAGTVCPAALANQSGGAAGTYNPGSLSLSSLPEGQVTLCWLAKDQAGNVVTRKDSWNKDTTPPQIVALSTFDLDTPVGYANGINGLRMLATLSTAETVNVELYESASCASSLNFSQNLTGPSLTRDFDLNLVHQGSHSFSVRAQDVAGNWSACETRSLVLDITPPTVSAFALNGGGTLSPKSVVDVGFTSSDTGTGVKSFSLFAGSGCAGALMSGGAVPLVAPLDKLAHGLAAGTSGTFSVRVFDFAGNSSCSNNFTLTYAMPILQAYATSAPYFNDWITSDGSAVCPVPTSAYVPDSCVWAGEKRKVVTDEPDCTGLSVADDFTVGGVFAWSCKQVDLGGGVYRAVFYASLKPGKGLKDLIESDGGTGFRWKNGSMILSGGSQGANRTVVSGGLLWSDLISPLPDQDVTNTPRSLPSANTIYVIDSVKRTSGYTIDGPNMSIVGIGAGKLLGPTSAGTFYPIIQLNGARPWVEVDMDTKGASSNYAQMLVKENSANCTFARIHNLSGVADRSGMTFTQCHGLQVSDVHLRGSRTSTYSGFGIISSLGGAVITRASIEKFGPGISLTGAANATVSKVTVSDNDGNGLSTSSLSGSLRLSDVISSNNSYRGFDFTNGGATKFVAQNLLAGGNGSDGFYFYFGTNTNSTFVNLASFASGGHGFSLNNWSGSKFHYLTSGISVDSSLSISSDSANNVFSQMYLAGTSGGTNIDDATTALPTTYLGTIAHEGNCFGVLLTSNCMEMGVIPVGDVNVDKSAEGAPTFVGSASYLWNALNFNLNLAGVQANNGYKTFGQYAGDISSLSAGFCDSGACGQWDWRLKNADSVLRGAAADGDGTNVLATIVGGNCPADLGGNASLSSGGVQYLKNAIEISTPLFPGYVSNRGNHNGLCESGEVCLAAPNLGFYQGDFRTAVGMAPLDECVFTPGTVSGVKMYLYPSNAVAL